MNTKYVHIFFPIAYNHSSFFHFNSPSLQHCQFFCWLMVHWWCVVCIVHFQSTRNVSYIALHFATTHAHIARMQNDSYSLRNHMKHKCERVCSPNVHTGRTGNDSFYACFILVVEWFRWWCMYCAVHSMLCRGAVRTHISFIRSFVRPFICYTSSFSQYMLIALIQDREVAAKSSSKSDSVELSIESVAFFTTLLRYCVYLICVYFFSVFICVRVNC